MKLHIGCGNIILPSWTNCDTRPLPGVDLVAPANTLPLADETVSEIYACHVLEHFGYGVCTPSFMEVLLEWNRVLCRGGLLRVAVPDLGKVGPILAMASTFQEQWNVTRLLYGGSEYAENRHFVGFTELTLSCWLREAGFANVRRFEPFAEDTSKFQMLGIPVSLNLQATKP